MVSAVAAASTIPISPVVTVPFIRPRAAVTVEDRSLRRRSSGTKLDVHQTNGPGLIFDRSTGCVATDAGRRPLGRFATWREASVVIHEARRALAPIAEGDFEGKMLASVIAAHVAKP